MATRLKSVFLISMCVCLNIIADDVPVFVKPQKVKKLSSAKLKESICYELEALLTLSSDLIAFLADSQRAMIAKMHCVITPEKGEFFSDANTKELDLYLQDLTTMRQKLETSKQEVERQFKKLSKNFTT